MKIKDWLSVIRLSSIAHNSCSCPVGDALEESDSKEAKAIWDAGVCPECGKAL